jgi:hypothetical protein
MGRTMTQPEAVEPETNLDELESFRKRNDDLVAEIARLDVEVKKLRMEKDQLQKRIPVKGFLLMHDDPFALGTMRSYVKAVRAEKRDIFQLETLPFTLPHGDPLARKALEIYAVRAAGGGDMVRATTANDALELFPK